ncbi:MAG: radical SAM family heme chaperone HemW [Desulfuromonadaceae bacterium]|nr:radical SAM family heme chaperone HemW [Desulfuromonadaceae bacterium]MDD2855679.1 radical SAM family heme chaperone HemW [Desulfuromonadaceae bacterium]
MFNRLYVHIPFCIKKCGYCAFVSGVPVENELEEYHELLISELDNHQLISEPLDSIYFGGGTPSLLKARQLSVLLNKIRYRMPFSENIEITLEANPCTINGVYLSAVRDAGINRISLGIQSFDDLFLTALGRIHTSEQSKRAFRDIRAAGFNNVSIDLMHSLPGETLEQWRSELLYATDLYPEHISVYGLTIEGNTPFALKYPNGSSQLIDEDLSADMFELADEILTGAGFEHYEIANYARPGYRSDHNSGYWKRDGYLGLGVAAHSFLRDGYGLRFSNPYTLEEYRSMTRSGKPTRLDEYSLTRQDAMSEYLYLGLRLSDGVKGSGFESEFGSSIDSIYETTVPDLGKLGLLSRDADTVRLTLKGMLLSNQVFSRFL